MFKHLFLFKNGLLIAVLLLVVISGCNKHECTMPLPEDNLYFVLKKNDTVIKNDSFLMKTSLFYFDKYGDRVYDPSAPYNGSVKLDDTGFVYLAQSYFQGDSNFKNTGIMFLRYLASTSADSKVNNFYLQFPDSDIDTIFIQAEKVSCEQAWQEPCHCELPVTVLKFNGQLVSEGTTYLPDGPPVYAFNK